MVSALWGAPNPAWQALWSHNCPAAAVCCRLQDVGAGEVAAVFRDAEIDLSVLPHLNENDLQVRTGLLSTAQHSTPALCGLMRC